MLCGILTWVLRTGGKGMLPCASMFRMRMATLPGLRSCMEAARPMLTPEVKLAPLALVKLE